MCSEEKGAVFRTLSVWACHLNTVEAIHELMFYSHLHGAIRWVKGMPQRIDAEHARRGLPPAQQRHQAWPCGVLRPFGMMCYL